MKTFIKSYIISGVVFSGLFSFVHAQDENKYSEEKIPYGVGEMNIPLSFMQSKEVEYGTYSIPNPNPAASSMQPYLEYGNLANVKNFSIGTGADIHLPLIYLLISKDKSRFRIADDIGLGFTLGSNTVIRKDYFTGEKLPETVSKSAVGGSIAFWAGAQAFYRINNLLDVGLKYYPYYVYFGLAPSGGAVIKGYGLHTRIAKIYLDYLYISPKKIDNTHPVTHNFKIKYLLKKRNFVFINVMYNRTIGPFKMTAQLPLGGLPQDIVAVKNVPATWRVYQIGWGIMF